MKKIYLILPIILISFLSIGQVKKIKVALHLIEGYGEYEDFAERAILKLEEALNSDEFRKGVLNGTFIRTKGLSNKELFDIILQAHELQGPGGQDSVVDLRARTLRINSDESRWKSKCKIGSRAGTIGIDGNGDGVTAICPQRLEKWDEENNVAKLAGHYAHEYMHILGFSHKKRFSRDRWRQKTFVYKIGNLVSDIISKQQDENSGT